MASLNRLLHKENILKKAMLGMFIPSIIFPALAVFVGILTPTGIMKAFFSLFAFQFVVFLILELPLRLFVSKHSIYWIINIVFLIILNVLFFYGEAGKNTQGMWGWGSFSVAMAIMAVYAKPIYYPESRSSSSSSSRKSSRTPSDSGRSSSSSQRKRTSESATEQKQDKHE